MKRARAAIEEEALRNSAQTSSPAIKRAPLIPLPLQILTALSRQDFRSVDDEGTVTSTRTELRDREPAEINSRRLRRRLSDARRL